MKRKSARLLGILIPLSGGLSGCERGVLDPEIPDCFSLPLSPIGAPGLFYPGWTLRPSRQHNSGNALPGSRLDFLAKNRAGGRAGAPQRPAKARPQSTTHQPSHQISAA
jgi:hypothetical protein